MRRFPLLCLTFVSMTLLVLSFYGAPAYGQGAPTPPVFFTTQQYQTAQARYQLELGGLAGCTVPPVTITHSPGYVVPTTAPQILYANLQATPHAVCNDGSPAAFLFRPGFGVAASRWVIYLDGGGQCNDEVSCVSREISSTNLVSTEPYLLGHAKLAPLAGILSPDPAQNPDFYDANLVQVDYCSSDYFMGEQDGNKAMTPKQILNSDNVANWYFDGHGVVQGIIELLQQSYGLNNATDVLLTGGSAGAVGVFMNANFVSGLLPLRTRFAVLADSGYSLSAYPDYDASTGGYAALPTNAQTVAINGKTLWAAIGDFDCAYSSNLAGTGYNNVACAYPDALSQNGTFRLPFFIRSSYHDDTILNTYNINLPLTSAEVPYADNFDDAMAQSLNTTNPWLALFALNSTIHTMIKNAAFTNRPYAFPGHPVETLAAAVGAWYRSPCTAPRLQQKPTLE